MMASKRFAKTITATLSFLVTIVSGAQVFAQTPPAPGGLQLTTPPGQCDKWFDKLQKDQNDILQGCQATATTNTNDPKAVKSCLDNIYQCQKSESDALSDEGTDQDQCSKMANLGCADVNGTTASNTKDRDTARKDRLDAQKERDDQNKQNADQTKQAQDQSNQLNQQMQKDNQDFMQKQMDASQKLQQAMSDMDDQRSKAVKEAQQSYDKINAAYVEMRDTLRRKTSTVNSTTLDWNVQCRNAATLAGKQTEDDFNKRMDEEAKIATNYQLSSASGRNNRLLKKKRQKILDSYNTMLTRCLQGQDGPGVELKQKLDSAQHDLADTTASSNDHAAVLETQRQNILSDMSQLEQSLDKKASLLTQQNSQNMMMLQYTHMQNQGMLQQQITQSQAQAQQQQQISASQAKNADDRLKEAKNDELVASGRLKCGANISDSEAADSRKNRVSAKAAAQTFTADCASYYTGCVQKANTGYSSYDACPSQKSSSRGTASSGTDSSDPVGPSQINNPIVATNDQTAGAVTSGTNGANGGAVLPYMTGAPGSMSPVTSSNPNGPAPK